MEVAFLSSFFVYVCHTYVAHSEMPSHTLLIDGYIDTQIHR